VTTEESFPDGRRREIADIALAQFLTHGYARTSMAGIARVVGIEKASLYYHFKGKEDLFLHALSVNFAEPMDRIGELAAVPGRDPVAVLTEALGILYDVMIDGPIGRLSSVIAETARTVPSVARRFHDDFIRRFEQAIELAHRPVIEAGRAPDLPPKERDLLVFSPLLHLAITAGMFEPHPDLHAKYLGPGARDRYVETMLGALRVTRG
jgi:AcrR family transcriptional regulator